MQMVELNGGLTEQQLLDPDPDHGCYGTFEICHLSAADN
jgi:hypothetical protein